MASYDDTIKMMLLGDARIEKTFLTLRSISGFFLDDLKLTIGVDFYSKTLNLDNKKIKLQIWDFGGEERFRFLLHQYCKDANAAFFLYDITNRLSLDHLPDWTQIIRENAGDIPIMLVGGKAHLKEFRAVSKEEGILAAKKYNLSGFIEVSSKTGQNVEKAFEALTRLVLIQPVFCQKCKKEFTFEEFIKHPCKDRYPYPYIFKPPEPPEDLAVAPRVQLYLRNIENLLKIKDRNQDFSLELLAMLLLSYYKKHKKEFENFLENIQKLENFDESQFPYSEILKLFFGDEQYREAFVRDMRKRRFEDEDRYPYYFSGKLTKEEQLTHSCKNKPKNK